MNQVVFGYFTRTNQNNVIKKECSLTPGTVAEPRGHLKLVFNTNINVLKSISKALNLAQQKQYF